MYLLASRQPTKACISAGTSVCFHLSASKSILHGGGGCGLVAIISGGCGLVAISGGCGLVAISGGCGLVAIMWRVWFGGNNAEGVVWWQ